MRVTYRGGDAIEFGGGPTLPACGGVFDLGPDDVTVIAASALGARLIESGALTLAPGHEWPTPAAPVTEPAPVLKPAKKSARRK